MAGMFKLLRFFSISCLVTIFLTAVPLALFYRHLLIEQTVEISQKGNLDLAQSLLTSVRNELDEYLASVEQVGAGQDATQSLSVRVRDFFRTVIRDTSVVRIKLYNERGVVVFSTDPAQIGAEQKYNAGIISAGSGRPIGGLAYRGSVNAFEREIQDDNLIETYVPVRASLTGPVRGVFEIYTKATPLVSQSERAVVLALIAVAVIQLCQYVFLMLAVRRARNIIDSEGVTIRQRTASLEKTTADLLQAEEAEKQKLAAGLHEGLAQTLSAVKTHIEQNLARTAGNPPGRSLARVIPALQDAIREVRAIATDLRPASLDDLGLLPTIDWLCRQVELRHPEVVIEQDLSIQESELPGPLKIVIYRLIESALRILSLNPDTDRIRLALRRTGQTTTLTIDEIRNFSPGAAAAQPDTDDDLPLRFATMQERTSLSGGRFSAMRNQDRGVTLRATWNL